MALCVVLVASTSIAAAPPPLNRALELRLLRVDPSPPVKLAKTRFHGYRIVAGPVRADARTRELFARTMTTGYSVPWPTKYCAFSPVYGASFLLGERHIDVLMCPGCDETQYYDGARWIRTADFGAVKLKLVPIYDRLFVHNK